MEQPYRVGISSCLLGNAVRYDGGHKLDQFLRDALGRYVQFVPVCPEVECGLPVPREAMRLVGETMAPRLIMIRSGVDLTEQMRTWADQKNVWLAEQNLCGFIFKSKSPSCGIQGVAVYFGQGLPKPKGIGLFARMFMERFPLLPVEDDGRLHDPALRENFIERIFVLRRWQKAVAGTPAPASLSTFQFSQLCLKLIKNDLHRAQAKIS